MATDLDFHFPISLLLDQGDKIVAAAEANTDINARLPSDYVTESRTLIADVTGGDATQKGDVGEIGTLTIAQNAALTALHGLIAGAKDTAKRAFKGNDTKLHAEFQVGINKPTDLASVLERARIVSASLKKDADRGRRHAGNRQERQTRRHQRAQHRRQRPLRAPAHPPERRQPAMARDQPRQHRVARQIPPRQIPPARRLLRPACATHSAPAATNPVTGFGFDSMRNSPTMTTAYPPMNLC